MSECQSDCKLLEWDGRVTRMSFSGCGFRASYHLGAIQCFRDRGRDVLEQIEVFSGASAGGLCAALMLMECPIDKALNFMRQMVREMQSNLFGPLNPSFMLTNHLRDGLDFLFPKHAHKLATNRLHISVTAADKSNKIITHYATREEFLNAILASSYIPGYMGLDFPTYKGQKFVDGALSNNLPYASDMKTITISALTGDFDICPTDPNNGRYSMGCYTIVGHKMDLSLFNLQNLYRGIFPSSEESIDELYLQGYRDTMRFLLNQCYIQDFSVKIQIPIPATCSVLSYTSEGSVCIDMDSLVAAEDEVFLKTVDDEGFFEAELPKKKIPTKPPEPQKSISDYETAQ